MLLFLCLVVSVFAAPDGYAVIPEDPHNADTLSSDPEEVKYRVDCYLDRQPCNELNIVYKSLIPDILIQECSQCTPYIKHYYHRFNEAVKKLYPEEYQAYRKKFDPEGIHFDALEAVVHDF